MTIPEHLSRYVERTVAGEYTWSPHEVEHAQMGCEALYAAIKTQGVAFAQPLFSHLPSRDLYALMMRCVGDVMHPYRSPLKTSRELISQLLPQISHDQLLVPEAELVRMVASVLQRQSPRSEMHLPAIRLGFRLCAAWGEASLLPTFQNGADALTWAQSVQLAAREGNEQILVQLLTDSRELPPYAFDNAVLKAIGGGHWICAALLLTEGDLFSNQGWQDAVQAAVGAGQSDLVRQLFLAPHPLDVQPIIRSCSLEMFKLLEELTTLPSDEDLYRYAVYNPPVAHYVEARLPTPDHWVKARLDLQGEHHPVKGHAGAAGELVLV